MSTSNQDDHRTRAPYHHGALREALIEAAEALLEEGGPKAVSLREVARRVGVSHNAPYRHFADRETLLAEVAARGFRAMTRRLAEAEATAPPGRALHARPQAYLRFAQEKRGVYLLMFGSEIDKTAYQGLAEAASESFQQLLNGVLREGAPAPGLVEALNTWAYVHGLAHLVLDGQLKGFPVDLDSLVQAGSDVFRAGLSQKAHTGTPPR
ncbi:TetR/AcrR family transcriptional regulator [Zavarzinia sp. CC-PAN008]|uniref:TetR/AcrR family transcriptional regulator n=1 Tax=Zavarzinia sp. CC-PAN008 TaxID=3243332 RepID=UPI003F7432A6